jgi:hypothetical protein
MSLMISAGAPTLFIRRAAYEKSGLRRVEVDERLGLTADEFRVDGDLVVLGPIPDPESVADIINELEESGLAYFDDFFELSGNWPDWLKLVCATS